MGLVILRGFTIFKNSFSLINPDFKASNFKVVPFNQYADAYIINTCSVTENADNKFKVFVNKALKINPNAFVAAIGCYAQLKPEELLSVKGVDLVLGASEKFNIVNYLQNIDQDFSKFDHSCNINDVDSFIETYSTNSRTRAFLKVQDGCDYKCSFCTIPLARGKSRSNSIENVVKNVKEIISNGIKEIVLTGINLGDFGKRQSDSFVTNEDFLGLIKTLDKIDGVERYRVSSIEPNLLTDEVISFISKSNEFVPHFHIPLQSGSDQILKKMRRRYKTDLYESRVELIRKLMPNASIGVDVIVGFPGETDEDVKQTIDFAQKVDADYYSLSVLAPYYGTELYEQLIENGHALDKQPWEYFFHQSPNLMVNDKISTAVLKEYLSLADLNKSNKKRRGYI